MKELIFWAWDYFTIIYIPYRCFKYVKKETAGYYQYHGRYPRNGFVEHSPVTGALSGMFIGSFLFLIGFGAINWVFGA